jgi:tRNA modification GTPase
MYSPPSPLTVVVLTPSGRGAVASLLLYGSQALEVFLKHFSKRIKADENEHYFGSFEIVSLNRREQVVVHCPSSDEVEIHCHGGEVIVEEITKVFIQDGATLLSWQDFFCGGNTQKETALSMLPFAATERTAQILLDQYNGALEQELSSIETIQDENEKLPFLKRLQENGLWKEHLTQPFRVVLAGASNAGKSSMLNAIVGFQRSIVHQSAGTTRDVVSVQTAIDGFPFEFCDTAGFREAAHELEQQGIRRSEKMLAEADLILWVIDATLDEAEQLFPPKSYQEKTLVCFNKTDIATKRFGEDILAVSAKNGEGIDRLLQTIRCRLIPRLPLPFEGVPLG